MDAGFSYRFPSLRGIQAQQEYFVAMCPLKLLPRLFQFDDPSLPADLRAQRTLNSARIPEIARYVVENRTSYVFSSITASIDGEVRFLSLNENQHLGILEVSMSARFIVNDGQHRRAAIQEALEEMPEIGDEAISVVFFIDKGLGRSQQIFADLNKHAVKPTNSIGILYDHRDPLSVLARDLAASCAPFRNLTELEKTSISNRSTKLFTLSSIFQATSSLLGKKKNALVTDEDIKLAKEFWTLLTDIIPQWGVATRHEVSSAELRRDYVNVHGILLHALGIAGNRLFEHHGGDWRIRVGVLRDLDWSRSNPEWEGRAMQAGRMSRSAQNLQKTANHLTEVLEERLQRGRTNIKPTGGKRGHTNGRKQRK